MWLIWVFSHKVTFNMLPVFKCKCLNADNESKGEPPFIHRRQETLFDKWGVGTHTCYSSTWEAVTEGLLLFMAIQSGCRSGGRRHDIYLLTIQGSKIWGPHMTWELAACYFTFYWPKWRQTEIINLDQIQDLNTALLQPYLYHGGVIQIGGQAIGTCRVMQIFALTSYTSLILGMLHKPLSSWVTGNSVLHQWDRNSSPEVWVRL